MEQVLRYMLLLAWIATFVSFSHTVYETISKQRGKAEGARYAGLTLAVPFVGIWFLYKYGYLSATTRNLTTFGRMTVATFVVLIGPFLVLLVVTPPNSLGLFELLTLALVVVAPLVYLVLFGFFGFDIKYRTEEPAS